MRVLVTWGSKLGGTEGIAQTIGEELGRHGLDVVSEPASRVRDLQGYDAAIVGGALYANRWHRDAHRFVTRNVATLRRMPVWLFSSGPLDDSAEREEIPPPTQVAVLMERVGALGHVTFGGRLPADAKGFPASAMAKKMSGDWRDEDRIRAWAAGLAKDLPNARPGTAVHHPARSPWRLLAYAVAAWAASAALAALGGLATGGATVAVHAVATPLIFGAVAIGYFRARGARDPVPTAFVFTAVALVLDAVVFGLVASRSLALFASILGTWLPLALIFLVTWAVGFVVSMMPAPGASGAADRQAPESPS